MRARKSASTLRPWMIRCLACGAGLLALGCQALLPADVNRSAEGTGPSVPAMATGLRHAKATPGTGYPAQAPTRRTSGSPRATETLRPTSTPVPTRTPTASPTTSPFGEVISRFDVTGDGQPEVISHVAKSVVVFESALGEDGKAVELARAPDQSQFIDLDEDGDYEILTPASANRWQTLSWDEGAFVEGEPVIDPPAPTPAPVSNGALPWLRTRGDLFFERDGLVLRWPRGGGRTDEVWPRSAAYEGSGWQWEMEAGIYDPGLRRRWNVSGDGSKLAVVERQDPPADQTGTDEWYDHRSLPRRFRVIDLVNGGQKILIPARGQILDSWFYEGWGLTADGRWLVYLAHNWQDGQPEATPEPFVQASSVQVADLMAVDLANPSLSVRLAACRSYTPPPPGDVVHGTSGCMGLSIAPDGRRVAYSDGQGLWVVGMPDATGVVAEPPRMVAAHDYGADEGDIHQLLPAHWSPDGDKILAVQTHWEGSEWAIVDFTSGKVDTVPNSTEWNNLGVKMTWLPGGQSVVNARYGDALGQGGLTRIDANDVSQITPLLPEFRITENWQVVGAKVMADGAVRFGLRQAVPAMYRSDGVFEVGADGRGWHRLASLPPMPVPADDFYYPDHFLWSPDGSAFLAVADDPQWTPVSGHAWLGLESGERVVDAGEVLRGARWVRWVGGE